MFIMETLHGYAVADSFEAQRLHYLAYLSMTAVAMPGIKHMLQQGPPHGDVCKGLDKLRDSVLTNGIPSNPDGMVRLSVGSCSTSAEVS